MSSDAVTPTSNRAQDFDFPYVDDPLDQLWAFLKQYEDEEHHPIVERYDDEIVLHHDWLKHECWLAHDIARNVDGLHRAEFTVRTKDNWHDPAPVTARYRRGSHAPGLPAPSSLDEVLVTLYEHYPWELGEVQAEDVEYKCGDVSGLLCESLWQGHGIRTNTVGGGVYDPETQKGWPHGFVILHPKWLTDEDEPVIVDGTAKQFCDEWSEYWPVTLAPKADLAAVHVVRPGDAEWDNYTTNRNTIEKPEPHR